MMERRTYRAIRAAARFFVAAKLQGFSPSLIRSADGFDVCIWGAL